MSKNLTSRSTSRNRKPKTRWGLEKIPESQRLNEKSFSNEYFDKIRPQLFDVIQSIEVWINCSCAIEALSIATQTPIWKLYRLTQALKISNQPTDEQYSTLISTLGYEHKAYYVDENASLLEQINLLYEIDHVAILTLEGKSNNNLLPDFNGDLWAHCEVWEPQLRRILEPTDAHTRKPSTELQYYDIAHVIEFPSIKTLLE